MRTTTVAMKKGKTERPVGRTTEVGCPGRPHTRRLEGADGPGRQQGATRRRRSVRHQHAHPCPGHRAQDRQQHSHQAQPDRHLDRDAASDRYGRRRGLLRRGLAPLRRDRGRHDRRHRRRHGGHPDQDWIAVSIRPAREV
jgi:hypothetical protein